MSKMQLVFFFDEKKYDEWIKKYNRHLLFVKIIKKEPGSHNFFLEKN